MEQACQLRPKNSRTDTQIKNIHGEIKREAKLSCPSQEDQTEFLKKRQLKDLEKMESDFFGERGARLVKSV